ncbi:hypothetical protein F2Q69_00010385 [Brassica cretica]|uniref:WAT1-related protein n=1 Tax=Brassica cretica TaxID=69181 RepID=A0A8S9QZS4_BRACR|nr:hypothetical protein F2Q69_00010385 [Brassica cretica]
MMQREGPVFVTAFNPLVVVIVSIMSFFVLGQGMYLEGVIGLVVSMVGVYAVLWDKHVDDDDKETCFQAVEKEASLAVVVFCRENGDDVSRC